MILLMSRLPGGHSMSAGRRPEKLGYQQSTVCWYVLPGQIHEQNVKVVISWEHCMTETSLESKTTLVMYTWSVCVSWLSCTFQGGVQPNVVPPEFKASEYDICYWNSLWKKSWISVSLFYLLILSDKLYNHSTEPSLWPTQLYGTVYQQQFVKLTACICLSAGSNNCHLLTYIADLSATDGLSC